MPLRPVSKVNTWFRGEEVQVACGPAGAGDAFGEFDRHVLQAAGVEEERLDRFRLSLKDLLGQVGEDVHAQAWVGECVFQG